MEEYALLSCLVIFPSLAALTRFMFILLGIAKFLTEDDVFDILSDWFIPMYHHHQQCMFRHSGTD